MIRSGEREAGIGKQRHAPQHGCSALHSGASETSEGAQGSAKAKAERDGKTKETGHARG